MFAWKGVATFERSMLVGNLVLVPAVAWGLIQWLPTDLALRLGVLLVPCTDWEIAAVVIVVQLLVGLFGMVFHLWWIPHCLFGQRT